MKGFPIQQRIIMYFLLAMVIIMQGLVLFWAFWPYEPLRVDYAKIIYFKNGDRLAYELSGEKFSALPAEVTRQFVDGITVSLPAVSGNIDVGKFKQPFATPIPMIPPGKYYMKWTAVYKVNPIREVSVTTRTPCFEVN